MKKTLLFFCIFTAIFCGYINGYAQSNATEIYVSAIGSDSEDGSIENPFHTIEKAKEFVRSINKNMKQDIIVYIREGVYVCDNTLNFTKEDSGSNGYYVTYKAYNNENVKISGGSQVNGWKKLNDKIWYTKLDNVEYVRQLYVNDRRARRAQSEELYPIKSIYSDVDGEYKYDGITVNENKFLSYKNKSDIQIHIAIGWKSFLINIEDIIENENNGCLFMLHRKSLDAACSCPQHYIEPGIQFYIENAFEELDKEGEFYYNRNEKNLYYMPRSDEDMTDADVYLANLEKLINIKGEDANNRVHNINFDGITFAHAAWNRPSKVGLINDQAQMMTPDDTVDIPANPGFSMVPANISLERAEKVNFYNCVIKDMGAVGIGFVRGCVDCKLTGNVFCDIFDSAVTLGVLDEMYNDREYIGRDLACGKPVTASSYTGSQYPLHAVDNDTFTVWSPKDGACWLQVDLEDCYEIDRIEIDPRGNGVTDSNRCNIDVLASNDSNFSTYSVLGSTSMSSYTDKNNTLILYVENTGKYRYIRFKKNMYMSLSSLRIINESIPYAPSTELCKNIKIDNNYITRIGLVNFGAPAIQGYYNENMNVSHNEMNYIPYSGVCSGWGWTLYGETDCRDNKINYNRIENCMLIQFDGGAIYTLGKQPNSVQIGNYITNQINDLAALYLDNGTSFYTNKENVLDAVPSSYHMAEGEGNLWIDNHTTSIADSLQFNLQQNSYASRENELFAPGAPNTTILKIMQNAGLGEEYKSIKEKAGENYWPWTRYEMTQNIEVHGGYGSEDNRAVWIAKYYIRNHIDSIKTWITLIKVGDDIGMYPQSAVDNLNNIVAEAEGLLTGGNINRSDVMLMFWKIRDGVNDFKNSRNKVSQSELIDESRILLENTQIGSREGMTLKENYDKLAMYSDNLTKQKTEKASELMEAAIIEFKNNLINFNIKTFRIENQKGNAQIDNENATINVEVFANSEISGLTADVSCNEGAYIKTDLSAEHDYSGLFKFDVSNFDGTDGKEWTVNVTKEKVYSSDEIISFDESVNDIIGWNTFGAYNYKYYANKRFGDITIDFNMIIEESRKYDWPCFVFRSQNNNESFDSSKNEAYVMVFGSEGIEFYRFNNGVRTQFYGNISSIPQLFGSAIKTDAFKFGEKNKFRLTCRNVSEGVKITMLINGIEVFDFVDSFEGAVKESGYIGSVSPGAAVRFMTD